MDQHGNHIVDGPFIDRNLPLGNAKLPGEDSQPQDLVFLSVLSPAMLHKLSPIDLETSARWTTFRALIPCI